MTRFSNHSVVVGAALLSVLTGCAEHGAAGLVPPGLQPTFNAIPNHVVTVLKGLTEYPIPTANLFPEQIAAGPDGNLWFTERDASQIGRITNDGKIKQFPIPAKADSITGARDGLWFTFSSLGAVGHMTTSGEVRVYKIPRLCKDCTSAVPTTNITIGSDGALWFAAAAGCGRYCARQFIIRMTTRGTFSKFGTSLGAFSAIWSTVGPDDAIWFACLEPGGFGRITNTGAFTFYYDKYVYGPAGITLGPDHALWFTDWTSDGKYFGQRDSIGRLTTEGTITKYPINRTPNSFPYEIVSGPDGNLWFTEPLRHRIGRSTTNGSITEFSLAASANPYGITVGPRGWIWFTERDANKIAKFEP